MSVMTCYVTDVCDNILCSVLVHMTGRGVMGHGHDWQEESGSWKRLAGGEWVERIRLAGGEWVVWIRLAGGEWVIWSLTSRGRVGKMIVGLVAGSEDQMCLE